MTFGNGGANFLRDVPAAVGQCAGTRLKLWEGEWYLDLLDGTPYFQQILGQGNRGLASALIEQRILGTPFVSPAGLSDLGISYNSQTRDYVFEGDLGTVFGQVSFSFPVRQFNVGPFELGGDQLGPGGGGLG